MIDVLKKIKLNLFNSCLIVLWCFLALIPNLNADTLDEVLRLTFSTNKQLLLSRTQLQSSKSADISNSYIPSFSIMKFSPYNISLGIP